MQEGSSATWMMRKCRTRLWNLSLVMHRLPQRLVQKQTIYTGVWATNVVAHTSPMVKRYTLLTIAFYNRSFFHLTELLLSSPDSKSQVRGGD